MYTDIKALEFSEDPVSDFTKIHNSDEETSHVENKDNIKIISSEST